MRTAPILAALIPILAPASRPPALRIRPRADSRSNSLSTSRLLPRMFTASWSTTLETGGIPTTHFPATLNLTIDEKPTGCFCEKLPNGGGVRHMEVARIAPGKALVLVGALGPLQSMATNGTMTIEFSPLNGGTKLDVTYAVAGYRPEGMKELAALATA